MAIIKCHECSAEISDTAKACPHCGAKPKKKIGWIGWIFAGFFILFVVRCTGSQIERTEHQAAPLSPEQVAAKQKAEKRHQLAIMAMLAIKKAARDPDSVQWQDVLIDDDATTACITYRARNGFGGYAKESAVFFGNKASQTAKDWNKHCAGRSLIDHKFSARALP